MRVLLDECVDTRLASHIQGFETRTVHDQGWAGISNGKLLALAQAEFDVFITVDRNLSFQQHLPRSYLKTHETRSDEARGLRGAQFTRSK